MLNLFEEVAIQKAVLQEKGLVPVAVAMSWDCFASPWVEQSFIALGWEADYVRIKVLNPTTPISICGLPLCLNYGNSGPVLRWSVAVAP